MHAYAHGYARGSDDSSLDTYMDTSGTPAQAHTQTCGTFFVQVHMNIGHLRELHAGWPAGWLACWRLAGLLACWLAGLLAGSSEHNSLTQVCMRIHGWVRGYFNGVITNIALSFSCSMQNGMRNPIPANHLCMDSRSHWTPSVAKRLRKPIAAEHCTHRNLMRSRVPAEEPRTRGNPCPRKLDLRRTPYAEPHRAETSPC